MSLRSVSPRVVLLVALPLGFFLYLFLIPLETSLLRALNFRLDRRLPVLPLLLAFLSYRFLIPRALSFRGIRVRTKSVERLREADRSEQGGMESERTVHIRRAGWVFRIASAVGCCVGFLILLSEIASPWDRDSVIVFGLGAGILVLGLVLSRVDTTICEISEVGIRAPEDKPFRLTFVPWDQITGCEIVRDDIRCWCDYFVLRDRSGRCRFANSGRWLGDLHAADQARILRSLRYRFPLKAKGDQATARVASSAVWDRELDG